MIESFGIRLGWVHSGNSGYGLKEHRRRGRSTGHYWRGHAIEIEYKLEKILSKMNLKVVKFVNDMVKV